MTFQNTALYLSTEFVNENTWHFPFDQKFRFEFPSIIFRWRMEQQFPEFRKRGQAREVYPNCFSKMNFWLNGSNVGNSPIFTFSRSFSSKFFTLIPTRFKSSTVAGWMESFHEPFVKIVLFFCLQQKLAQLLVLPTPAQNE